MKFNRKKLLFVVLFIILGLIALRIPFTHIVGSKSTFTAFDFMAPITGGFLGSWFGVLAVLVVELINFFIKGMHLDVTTFVRFFPMLFAAIYFGTKRREIGLVPLVCIVLFLIHPIGRQVYYYPLAFWLLPALLVLLKKRLLANSLGATMTAHAVGSTAFLYAFNLPVNVWKSLMTIVPFERLTFALGIALSYLVINNVLNYLVEKQHISLFQPLVNQKLVFSKALISNL
ncbi:MAG: hypothetical protein NT135_02990 [Candidatus Berkelbacteria bacterium]|nr:hypothetical protein [Candidatus Berkelbacteria bacterium]